MGCAAIEQGCAPWRQQKERQLPREWLCIITCSTSWLTKFVASNETSKITAVSSLHYRDIVKRLCVSPKVAWRKVRETKQLWCQGLREAFLIFCAQFTHLEGVGWGGGVLSSVSMSSVAWVSDQ